MSAGGPTVGRDLVGTIGGMLIARPLEQRLQAAAQEAWQEFKTGKAEKANKLIWRWKEDEGLRSSVDRTAVFAMAGVTALTDKLKTLFGPFREVVGEAGEFFARTLPEIMPRILTPEAAQFTPVAGTTQPTREEASRILREYISSVANKFPRFAVGAVGTFNPARWLTRAGEQAQQAISACGPLAMEAFATGLDADLNSYEAVIILETEDPWSEMDYCWYAFNTPEEVMHFLTLPGRTARLRWLKILNRARRLNLLLSPEDWRRLRGQVTHLVNNDIEPLLRSAVQGIQNARANWRRQHPELFSQPQLFPDGWRHLTALIVPVAILFLALVINAFVGCQNRDHSTDGRSHQVEERR